MLDLSDQELTNVQTHRPQTPRELWEYCFSILGVAIPFRRCCPGHSSPFEAFCRSYFAREEDSITVWHASRGFGGKSFLLALLALVEALTLGASVNLLGGSGEQAKRVHKYLTNEEPTSRGKFWEAPQAPRWMLKSDPTATELSLVNGGILRALMASQTSIRGPHPQRLRMDEVDEMKLDLFDSAQGQTIGFGGVSSQTTISSTWQHPDGTMTEVLRRARERNWPVFQWCIGPFTMVSSERGEVPVTDLRPGDRVLTREGWKPVQHVTCMGTKSVLRLDLSNGRSLVVTPDHRIAVPGGWVEAGSLRPGDMLVASPSTFSTMSTSVGSKVEVLSGVGVSGGAMGPEGLDSDMGSPEHVLPVGHDLQMGRVHAPSVPADVVDFQTVGDGTDQDPVCEAVGLLFPVAASSGSQDSVTGPRVNSEVPVPAVRLGIMGAAGSEVVQVQDDTGQVPVSTVRTGLAPFGSGGSGRGSAVEAVHVLASSSIGVSIPVYDLGVEGCHEFVAEGVVVHNCYRENLETDENPHGWLDPREVERKKRQVATYMWDIEYELQEPSLEGRAINSEAVKDLFDPALGEFPGSEGTPIILTNPNPRLRFYTGTDWAKSQDWTIIHTMQSREGIPDVLAAWLRLGRRPWPAMIAQYNQRVQNYGGPSAHDSTGVGGVCKDFLTVPSKPFDFSASKSRFDLINSYIAAIENREMVYPRINYAYDEHRYMRVEDLLGSGHLPDTVVAGALARWCRGNARAPLIGSLF